MSSTRAITLGMGYDTLEGAGGMPKGIGAITKILSPIVDDDIVKLPSRLEHDFPSSRVYKSQASSTPQIEMEETGYDIHLITNYTDLSKALGLTGATFAMHPAAVSLETKLLKEVELTEESLCLLITTQSVTKIKHISHNSTLTHDAKALLKMSQSNFIEVYGDEYVSEIRYGKKLYALIKFVKATKAQLNKMKVELKGNLGAIGKVKIGIEEQKNQRSKCTIADIKLDFSGVRMNTPDIGCDIDKLLLFIAEYNKKDNLTPNTIIGFSTKPYVTACLSGYEDLTEEIKKVEKISKNHAQRKESKEGKEELSLEYTQGIVTVASQLRWRIKKARFLLEECNHCYQRLRYMIPMIEKLFTGLKEIHFKNKAHQQVLNITKQLLTNANQLSESISIITQKIYEHKVNPDILRKIVINIKYKAFSSEIDNDKRKIEFESLRETEIYDELGVLIRSIAHQIESVLSVFDITCQGLSTNIGSIAPNRQYVRLSKLPDIGARVLWQIDFHDKESKHEDVQNIKFNLSIEKVSNNCFMQYCCFCVRSCELERHFNILHGDSFLLKMQPQDRINIQFVNPDNAQRKDFTIKAQVKGLEIFDLTNFRSSTIWEAKSDDKIDVEPLPDALQPKAFCFSMNGLVITPIPKTMPSPLSLESKHDFDEIENDERAISLKLPRPDSPVSPFIFSTNLFSQSQSIKRNKPPIFKNSEFDSKHSMVLHSSSFSSTNGSALISSLSSALLSSRSVSRPIMHPLSSSSFLNSSLAPSSSSRSLSREKTIIHPLNISSSKGSL
jgi:hypothetical protein